MNDMELLRQLAQETPLPAPAELDAARARLVAAITAAPAAPAPAVPDAAAAVPDAAAGHHSPSGRQPAGGLPRPAAPEPVLDAVKLMYGGAAGTVLQLIIALFFISDIKAYHLTALGHHLTTAQLSHLRPLIITLVIAAALVLVALWLWMARAVGQGRNWARILSTVLFGLATLELTGIHGIAQLFWVMLTWLTGLAAVWLLWRPASTAFFRQRRPASLTEPLRRER
jgi:hypothetical protein